MTEAMVSSHYQPQWWFNSWGDLTEWKWQPPSTTQERREKEKHSKISRIDTLIQWLEASDLDKPFLDPPTDTIRAGESTEANEPIMRTMGLKGRVDETQNPGASFLVSPAEETTSSAIEGAEPYTPFAQTSEIPQPQTHEVEQLNKRLFEPPANVMGKERTQSWEAADITPEDVEAAFVPSVEATKTENMEAHASVTKSEEFQVYQHLTSSMETVCHHIEVFTDSSRVAELSTLNAVIKKQREKLAKSISSAQFSESELAAVLSSLERCEKGVNVAQDERWLRETLENQFYKVERTIVAAVCSLCPPDGQDSKDIDLNGELGQLYSRSMGVLLEKLTSKIGKYRSRMFRSLMENLRTHDVALGNERHCHLIQRIVQKLVFDRAGVPVHEDQFAKMQSTWTRRLTPVADSLRSLPETVREGVATHMAHIVRDKSNHRIKAFAWLVMSARGELYSERGHAQLVRDFRCAQSSKGRQGGRLTHAEAISLVMETLIRHHLLDEVERRAIEGRFKQFKYPPFLWIPVLEWVGTKSAKRDGIVKVILAYLASWKEDQRLIRAVAEIQLSPKHVSAASIAREIAQTMLQTPAGRLRQFYMGEVGRLARKHKGSTDSPDPKLRRLPGLVNDIAPYFAEDKQLTGRQAQRGLEWCLRKLKDHPSRGREEVLESFTKILASKLEAGEKIGYHRQQFLIRKIQEIQGADEASMVETQLNEWNRHIERHRSLGLTKAAA